MRAYVCPECGAVLEGFDPRLGVCPECGCEVDEFDTVELGIREPPPKRRSYSLAGKLWGKASGKQCTLGLSNRQCIGMDRARLIDALSLDGFYKFREVPVEDLPYDLRKQEDTACAVAIAGKQLFDRGDSFPFDSEVVIEYHQLMEISVGLDARSLTGGDAWETAHYFTRRGFGKVNLLPKKDLKTGWLKKEGQIEKVTVDGFDFFRASTLFRCDVEVCIYYHCFKNSQNP